jgi:hypothetical protein
MESSNQKNVNPDYSDAEWTRVTAQGSILALWFAHAPPPSKGFREKVRLVRGERNGSVDPLDWRGPVNILSWGHLAKVLGKDHRFEFRHCEKNVCVTSADLSSQRAGDLIWMGKALLVVLRTGLQCPKRCHLKAEDPEDCVLAANWITARVLQAGCVCIDDALLATAQDSPNA